jgi:putative ABC transport system substrate-binding protein
MILALALALGISFAASGAEPRDVPTSVLELTEVRADRPTVLVLRKSTANMDSFVRGMVGELDPDFNVAALVVSRETTVASLDLAITDRRPDAIVVLDNPTAELYRGWQEAYPTRPQPPAIIVMALFVEQTAARIRNATGIAYEVPAVTSLGRLRSTIQSPVVRVGVIHRPQFAEFVAAQARIASIEGFEIVPYEVKQKPGVGQVRKGLLALDKLDVDAMWVLNDNVLLTPEVLVGAWLPLMRRNQRPVVVGVSSLLRTDPPVGSFAVLPDHESLGMQAAELIYELEDADWAVAGTPPQQPIAVETVLNKPFMERNGGIQSGAIDQIDEIIE